MTTCSSASFTVVYTRRRPATRARIRRHRSLSTPARSASKFSTSSQTLPAQLVRIVCLLFHFIPPVFVAGLAKNHNTPSPQSIIFVLDPFNRFKIEEGRSDFFGVIPAHSLLTSSIGPFYLAICSPLSCLHTIQAMRGKKGTKKKDIRNG